MFDLTLGTRTSVGPSKLEDGPTLFRKYNALKYLPRSLFSKRLNAFTQRLFHMMVDISSQVDDQESLLESDWPIYTTRDMVSVTASPASSQMRQTPLSVPCPTSLPF
jgi:hypothetical protein